MNVRHCPAVVPLAVVAGIVSIVGIVGGCMQATPPAFVIAPESAVVELRDGITERELAMPTKVVVLGTGTPIPDAYRAGSSIAIVHKGEAYLFDAGAGSAQNAVTARYKYDLPSLYPTEICCVFFTHLHSDHTLDYIELNFRLWWRRREPLLAFGPKGLAEMSAGMVAMMQPDIHIRTSGDQPVMVDDAYVPVVTELGADLDTQVVFAKDDLTVEAFAVPHGSVKPSFGYRITTDDLTVVVSGDTAYSEKVQEMATGADILLHEYISDAGLLRNSEAFQAYHRRSHITTTDVGRLATAAQPKLLVLYHGLHYGLPEQAALDEVRAVYDGDVALADDLDIFPDDSGIVE